MFDSRTQHRVLKVKKEPKIHCGLGCRTTLEVRYHGRSKELITTQEELDWTERLKTGSSKTKNEFLEKNGYLVIKDLWDPDELYHPVPTERL